MGTVSWSLFVLLGFRSVEYAYAVPRYLKLKGEYFIRNVGAYVGGKNRMD